MKYLKRFNESVDFEEKLRDFCETHLAYLLDEGFEVGLNDLNETYDSEITIKREDERTFTWNEVKDHIVPFIIHLNKEYKLYKTNGVKINDIGYIQSELSSIYEPFSIKEISDENYEPFLRYKITTKNDMVSRLSSIVIYAALAN